MTAQICFSCICRRLSCDHFYQFVFNSEHLFQSYIRPGSQDFLTDKNRFSNFRKSSNYDHFCQNYLNSDQQFERIAFHDEPRPLAAIFLTDQVCLAIFGEYSVNLASDLQQIVDDAQRTLIASFSAERKDGT